MAASAGHGGKTAAVAATSLPYIAPGTVGSDPHSQLSVFVIVLAGGEVCSKQVHLAHQNPRLTLFYISAVYLELDLDECLY